MSRPPRRPPFDIAAHRIAVEKQLAADAAQRVVRGDTLRAKAAAEIAAWPALMERARRGEPLSQEESSILSGYATSQLAGVAPPEKARAMIAIAAAEPMPSLESIAEAADEATLARFVDVAADLWRLYERWRSFGAEQMRTSLRVALARCQR